MTKYNAIARFRATPDRVDRHEWSSLEEVLFFLLQTPSVTNVEVHRKIDWDGKLLLRAVDHHEHSIGMMELTPIVPDPPQSV